MKSTQYYLNDCPSQDVLHQFAEGILGELSASVRLHVEKCKSCSTKLNLLANTSTVEIPTQSFDTNSEIEFGDIQVNDSNLTTKPGLLAGRYRLGDLIAAGGMGEVYRAFDVVFQREVAVKRLLSKYHGNHGAGERFRKEAVLTGQLQHPGIPPIHDLGSLPSGDPFLAMKLIAGSTLSDLLRRRKSPAEDLPQFLLIFEQIARAVGYAHAQGVIHRDLKPANVMVGEFGEVQVMDWGLAKRIGAKESANRSSDNNHVNQRQVTLDGTVMGTLAYMAPEQARGELATLGPRADVFALGAILFEILVGGHLYEGRSKDLLRDVQACNIGPAVERLKKSGVDIDLIDLTIHCLSSDTKHRPPNGTIVADQVAGHRSFVEERLKQAEIAQAAEAASAMELAKRRRVLLISIVAIALVFAAGAAISTMFALSAKSEAKLASDARLRTEEQQKRTLRQLYFAQILREDLRIDQGAVGVAQAALRTLPMEQRGFEHAWLTRKSETTPLSIRGHNVVITCLAFNGDGKLLASCGSDKIVRLWDTVAGVEFASLSGHNDSVNCVAFAPDGQMLASVSNDKTIRLWKTATRSEVRVFTGHSDAVNSIAFSPDGTLITSGSADKTIKLWDLATGREVLTLRGHSGPVNSVSFNFDGTQIASGSADGTIKLWNANTGSEQLTIRGQHVFAVRFSPDGKQVANASQEPTFRTWSTEDGLEQLKFVGHQHQVRAVAYSPDGMRIASASIDKTIKLWDAQTAEELETLSGHESYVTFVQFSPDGLQLASASIDGVIKLWHAPSSIQQDTLRGHEAPVWSVANSSDHKRIASGDGKGKIKIWDVRTGAELVAIAGHGKEVLSLAISSDGGQLASASADQKIKLWDLKTGTEFAILDGHENAVSSVAFSPDGRRLASGSHDRTIKLWDAQTGKEIATWRGHEKQINAVVFSPDGSRLASCDGNVVEKGTIKIWDIQTGSEIATFSRLRGSFTAIAFSPDGKFLASSGSVDHTVEIWDLKTNSKVSEFRGHDAELTAITFSPDGTQVFSGSKDGTIKLWDIETGGELTTLRGHESWVTSLAFFSDGRRLVSCSVDKTVKVWDARLGVELVTLPHQKIDSTVSFSADGKRIVTSASDGITKVWDAANGNELPNGSLPDQLVDSNVSPDGLCRVVFRQQLFEALIERHTKHIAELWSEANYYREYWRPYWYLEAATKAESSQNWFAAEWNLKKLKELNPKLTPEIQRLVKNKFANTDEFNAYVVLSLQRVQDERTKIQDRGAPISDADLGRISADGESVLSKWELVYIDRRNQVMIANADGASSRALPKPPAKVKSLSLLEDGDTLVACCDRKLLQMSISQSDSWDEIIELSHNPKEAFISPDGQRIAWLKPRKDAWFDLIVESLDGAEQHNLGLSYDLHWFNRGSELLYLGWANKWTIRRWNSVPGIEFIPPFPKGGNFYPAPSPDGSYYAVSMDVNDGAAREIGLISADGKRIRLLTDTGKLNGQSTFSPDGNYVAFLRTDERSTELSVVNTHSQVVQECLRDVAYIRPIWHTKDQLAGKKRFQKPPHFDANLAIQKSGHEFPKSSASFTSSFDRVEAINDGNIDYSQLRSDGTFNRWTAFGSPNASDWVQIEFAAENQFSRVELAICDEGLGKGVQAPTRYDIEYWSDGAWKPVQKPEYSLQRPKGNSRNSVTFEPITSKKVRVVFIHSESAKSGVSEIAVWP